jgi:polyisoprenoid-binding protein YceI
LDEPSAKEKPQMKLKLATAAMIAGLLTAGLLTAGQGLAQGTPDPAKAQAGTYKVESSHTRVQFTIDDMGLTDYWGDFSGVTGQLTLDPAKPAADQVSVTIPVDSVSTTNAKLDGELKSPMFLDAGAHPTMTFTSTSVTPTGPTSATVVGDLTLHGVTHPVTLQARFHGAGANPMTHAAGIGFDAEGELNRADFGVGLYPQFLSSKVRIRIAAAFEKAG